MAIDDVSNAFAMLQTHIEHHVCNMLTHRSNFGQFRWREPDKLFVVWDKRQSIQNHCYSVVEKHWTKFTFSDNVPVNGEWYLTLQKQVWHLIFGFINDVPFLYIFWRNSQWRHALQPHCIFAGLLHSEKSCLHALL